MACRRFTGKHKKYRGAFSGMSGFKKVEFGSMGGSRLRHDLSDPLAMVAMIASALHEFGESIDPAKQEGLKAQLHQEVDRAAGLASENGVALELDELKEAVGRFLENSADEVSNRELQAECARLIEVIVDRTK